MFNTYRDNHADVIVIGAGPAGISASISAARQGAKVILIERFPYVGGMSTLIPISMWPIVTAIKVGELEQSFAGFPQEVIDRLEAEGSIETVVLRDGIDIWVPEDADESNFTTAKWYVYDVEVLKCIFFDMLEEAGVDLRVNSLVVGTTVKDNCVTEIEVETLEKRETFTADIVIDATGSADVVTRSGIPTDLGHPDNGLIMPSSTSWRIGGVNTDILDQAEKNRAARLYEEKRSAGEIDIPLKGLGLRTICDGIIHIFGTRVFNANPLDPIQAANAEKEQRRQMKVILDFLKKEVPAFKNARLINTGVMMGMIGTRRIRGDYQITVADFLAGKKFEDTIATGTYRVEIWDLTGTDLEFHHLKGTWYTIPYRCLLPKGLDNVIAAGSCLSGEYEGMACWAIQSICMLTGQAAGTAAAICVKENKKTRDIDISKLQKTLTDNGVFLG